MCTYVCWPFPSNHLKIASYRMGVADDERDHGPINFQDLSWCVYSTMHLIHAPLVPLRMCLCSQVSDVLH